MQRSSVKIPDTSKIFIFLEQSFISEGPFQAPFSIDKSAKKRSSWINSKILHARSHFLPFYRVHLPVLLLRPYYPCCFAGEIV